MVSENISQRTIFPDYHLAICRKERTMIISQHGQTAVRSLAILDRFDRVTKQTECLTGHPVAFGASVCFIAIREMIVTHDSFPYSH
jgi:hypothetical protein